MARRAIIKNRQAVRRRGVEISEGMSAPSTRAIAPARARPGMNGAGARAVNVPQAQLQKNARAAAAVAQKRQIARAAEVLERQQAQLERQQAQLELEQYRRESLL